MQHNPADGDAAVGAARSQAEVVNFPLRSFRRTLRGSGVAERVAVGMIARHGPNAAREATIRLNRMIDRGNMAARDLWACVVHVIHERKAS
jgi:hypothetical protein